MLELHPLSGAPELKALSASCHVRGLLWWANSQQGLHAWLCYSAPIMYTCSPGWEVGYSQTENTLQLMVMLLVPIPIFAVATSELWDWGSSVLGSGTWWYFFSSSSCMRHCCWTLGPASRCSTERHHLTIVQAAWWCRLGRGGWQTSNRNGYLCSMTDDWPLIHEWSRKLFL